MTYKVPQKRKPSNWIPHAPPSLVAPAQEETPMGLINGIPPASVQEWRWALAAWSFGWEGKFEYQFDVAGGRSRRGGYVLDFLFDTVPLRTPVSLKDTYYHGLNPNDDLSERRLKALIGFPVRDVEIVYDYELMSETMAKQKFSTVIGQA